MISVSITGDKGIDNVLKNLGKELNHSILGAAHLAAAKPLIERERSLAPVGLTKNLQNSIGGTKTPIKKSNAIGEVVVGPRRKRGYKGFAGHLNEYGTKQRKNKRGANRGVMPVKKFAEPAFQQTKVQVESGIATQIGKKLVARMKRELGSNFIK